MVWPLIGCFFKGPLFDQLWKWEADVVWLTFHNDLLSSSKSVLATWGQIGCPVVISFTSSDSEPIESGFMGFTSGKSLYDTCGKPYFFLMRLNFLFLLGHVLVTSEMKKRWMFMCNLEMFPLKPVLFLWPNRWQINAGLILFCQFLKIFGNQLLTYSNAEAPGHISEPNDLCSSRSSARLPQQGLLTAHDPNTIGSWTLRAVGLTSWRSPPQDWKPPTNKKILKPVCPTGLVPKFVCLVFTYISLHIMNIKHYIYILAFKSSFLES